VPEAVLLGVGLDDLDLLVLAAGEPQIPQRLLVDREDRTCRPVLGAHVADRGAIGERHRGDAGAVELDELTDDAVLAKHLGDGQDEVGGGGTVRELTVELEPDDAGDQHADRLPQHGRLGLDAADAPAENTQPVHHRGVRIGADERVRVQRSVAREDHPREIFDVHLVHDSGARRDDFELVEGALSPAQELVTLAIALVLEFDVALEGVRRPEQIRDDRVVDDEFGRRQRIDPGGVAAELDDRLAHRREIDHGRDAGEVLHDDPGGRELDFGVRLCVRTPSGQRLDLVAGDHGAVLGAQQVLEQHLQAVRQAVGALDRRQPIDLVVLAAHPQLAACSETVLALGGHEGCLLCIGLVQNYLDVKIPPLIAPSASG
jgi:hypothetical protein